MKVLLLLALIGSSLAFMPEMQYTYEYEGRLGMGIPEIRNKFSGVGIKAVVSLQVQSPDNAIIKLSNIQVGEYVGDVGVKVTNPLPIQYSPLSGQGKDLEEPFEVFLKKDKYEVMVVPKADVEWMVNLRKSIAQLFLIEPIRGNVGFTNMFNTRDVSHDAFTIQEPTLFGICSVDYTLHPIDSSVTSEDKKNIDILSISNDEDYLMTRTINFDKCDDEVRVMHSSINQLVNVSKTLFGNVASRSSVMTVKLVKKLGSFVIQEGNVQGYFSVNPFGVSTDKLMSLTNQTLILQSSSRISNKFVVPKPNRFVDTWLMEIATPFSAPQQPVPFVNYKSHRDASVSPLLDLNVFTGINLNQRHIQKFQTTLDKLIEETAVLMLSVGATPHGKITPMSTDEGKITTMLDTALYVVRGVDVQGLEQLFEKYFNDNTEVGQMKLKMLIDVCASSTALGPIKMLLNEMQKQRITPERITSIFVTLSNSFGITPVLPDIMRFVKSLDIETHPFMTTNVWINFATVLRKLCITKETIPYQIMGSEQCDVRIITQDFIPFLKEKFDTTYDSYKRCSIVQSLANLRIPEAVHVISIIATGDYDISVRETAIWALKYPKVMEVMKKDHVFNLLMPIVHNTMEDPIVRQSAIIALLSWKPSPSWWYRIAASTWREPSKSVASFIYYLIKNNYYVTEPKYSMESRIAHFVLPLTKPMPPSSTFTYIYGKLNPQEFSSTFLNTAIMMDDESSMPRNLYTHFVTDFGGLRIPIVEAGLTSEILPDSSATMFEHITRMIPNELQKIIRTAPNRRTEEIFSETKKQLHPSELTDENSHRESTLFVQLFENLQFMAPLNPKTIPIPFESGSFDFLKTLKSGKNLQLSKFFNPTKVEFFLPTELGIPFIGKLSAPTVQSAEGNVKFTFGKKETPTFLDLISSNSFSVDLTTNYKLATKVITNFEAIVPWNEKLISSGVETMKSLSMPLKMRMSLESQGNLKNISFSIIPTHEKEFAAVYVHNIPYVARKSMWPGELITEYEKFETITVKGVERGIHQNKVVIDKELTGVDAAILWEGDIPFPFTYGNFYDNFNYPYKMISKIVSPSTKMFASAFVVNFGKSETKAIHPSVAFTYPILTAEDTTTAKKHEVTEDDNKAFIVRILTTGNENRFFESNFQTKVLARDDTMQRSEITYRYAQHFPRSKPQVYCVQIETHEPMFVDFQTLLKQLNSRNVDYSFSGKVVGGTSCRDAQFAKVRGSLKVSDSKKAVLVDEITKELNMNENSMMEMEDKPFFDQTSILIEYKEPLPEFFINMTYHMYDVFRGSQFPCVYNNYYNVKNSKGKITIEGERYVDGAWDLKVELPTENVKMDYFQLPFVYKLPLYFFQNTKTESMTGTFHNHLYN